MAGHTLVFPWCEERRERIKHPLPRDILVSGLAREEWQICVFFLVLYQRKEGTIKWEKAKEASFRDSAF